MPPLLVSAPAKLNLFLHVTGKRDDGYHYIESLTARTAWGDQLEISYSDELMLTVSDVFASSLLPNTQDNLVMKAARLLQEKSGCSKGAHIILRKQLPVGAGLGGGSADAAAVLMALETFWEVSLDAPSRLTLAMRLGSDVPACLSHQPAWVTGTGEKVVPLECTAMLWDKIGCVLVNPMVPLLTAKVFGLFAGAFSQVQPPVEMIRSFDELMDIMLVTHNALEAPAMTCLPVISDLLQSLAATSGCKISRMSGSGATCFGLYASSDKAKEAAEYLKKAHPDWWVQATTLIGGTGDGR